MAHAALEAEVGRLQKPATQQSSKVGLAQPTIKHRKYGKGHFGQPSWRAVISQSYRQMEVTSRLKQADRLLNEHWQMLHPARLHLVPSAAAGLRNAAKMGRRSRCRHSGASVD